MTERIFITGDKHGSFYPLFGLADHVDLEPSDVLLIAVSIALGAVGASSAVSLLMGVIGLG